jgi:L-threonylcarbamoyladenylate synthase
VRPDAARTVAAIRAGALVVIPTDTVYGLACAAHDETAAAALYALKGRPARQPTALVAASVEALTTCLPELEGSALAVAQALLPGPFTLVLPNPAERFPWLSSERRDTIGARVPTLDGDALEVLAAVGAVVATSANLPGGPDPRRVADVPAALLDGVAAVLDGGVLPGTPSTVLDLTGERPVVLREGAVPADVALQRVAAAAR